MILCHVWISWWLYIYRIYIPPMRNCAEWKKNEPDFGICLHWEKRTQKEFALVGSVLDKNLVSDYFSNIPILANICPCYLMSVFFIRIWYKIQIFWYWKSSQTCSSCWPEMILRRFKIQERFSRYCISYESKDTALKRLPTNRLVWRNSAWGRICHSNSQKLKHSNSQKSQIE